jgi:chorismate dehydratase
LLIGDPAITYRQSHPDERYLDLAQSWHAHTGLPFVFAVWAVRSGANLRGVDGSLKEAKGRGLENLGAIAQAEAEILELDAGFCRRYLETLLRFDLGAGEMAGLQRFYELAIQHGLAPAGRGVRFYRSATAAVSI